MNTASLYIESHHTDETTKSEGFQLCSIVHGDVPIHRMLGGRVWPDQAAVKQLVDRYPKLLFTDYKKILFPYRSGGRVTDLKVLEVHKLERIDGGMVYVLYEHPIDHKDLWEIEDVTRKVIIPVHIL